MPAEVFISYARKDWDRVRPWVQHLQDAGVSVWVDVSGIDGAQPWSQEIVEAIEACRVLVLMASPFSLASEQVLREVTLAFEGKKRLLPLLLEPVTLPNTFRYALAGLQQIDLSSGDPEERRHALLRALSRLGVRVTAPIAGLVQDERSTLTAAPAAPHVPQHNLPSPVTRFIGRERELEDVQQLLSTTRMLTLLGPGGAGKTRLALQVGAHLLDHYPDGVWLVELEALTDPNLVPLTAAIALGVREEPDRPLTVTLSDYLKARQILLILDNCEHVVNAAAQLAQTLLRTCPHLRLLATSREALHIAGEMPYAVLSLSLPDARHRIALDAMLEYEAIRLFVDRAATAKPGFTVTEQNAPAVAQVCRRLDGIPLALELAAARARVLTVEQIAQRLDDRFRLLTGGSRTALPRQQTLRALIDWSYDLLSEPERAVLRRLSAFSGGFILEAVEAVCAGGEVEAYEVLDLLAQLVDKSLVVTEEHEGEARYRLLETIRQYGHEQLDEAGEQAQVRRQHGEWFLQLAEQAEPQLQGPDQAAWLNRLELEHDNLRAALGWAAESGEAEHGLRLGAALWRFWSVRGYLAEGREWLTRLLALPGAQPRTAARARVLHRAGALANSQGDIETARSCFQESLEIGRELDDQDVIARTLLNLGLVADKQGDYTAARARFKESQAVYQELGDQAGIASSLNNLGRVAQNEGDYATAQTLFNQSLSIQRALGDRRSIGILLNNLGWMALNQPDLEAARTLYEESMEIWRELGIRPHFALALLNLGLVAHKQDDNQQAAALCMESLMLFQELGDKFHATACLMELAGVAEAQGSPERAARLFGAAEALREATGTPIPPADLPAYESQVGRVRNELGEAAFAAAWAEGRSMNLEQAIDFALTNSVRTSQN